MDFVRVILHIDVWIARVGLHGAVRSQSVLFHAAKTVQEKYIKEAFVLEGRLICSRSTALPGGRRTTVLIKPTVAKL